MEWIERLNQAVGYMEEHLTDEKVITIGARYGYDSPTAFNRAFQSIHAIAPSQVRNQGTKVKSYPPISFHITIKGEAEMEYRIEKRNAFRIVGVSAPLEKEIEKNFETVPKLWGKAAGEGIISELVARMNGEPKGILGVSSCNETEEWTYYIGVASDTACREGLTEYEVPAATWAIFSGEGTMPHSVQELEKRIVTEWLPTSGFEYANGPDLEVYLNADPQNALFEVWIPVSQK